MSRSRTPFGDRLREALQTNQRNRETGEALAALNSRFRAFLPENRFEPGTPVYLEAAPGLLVECLVVRNATNIGRSRLVQVVPRHGGYGNSFVDPRFLRAIPEEKGGR